ncbi:MULTISPECIES: hypothetical protein [unclassified Streptomyces]|uniref:hypothetical protein n=1 Tax=unclassified Streptomyces TaxID=2593676 RepID=UPI0033B03C4D|nr:hypothetical protein OG199_06610 [Streptomyces sp. NBC_01176]
MRRRTLLTTAPAGTVPGRGHAGRARAAGPGPVTAATHREKAGGTTLRALHVGVSRLPA